VVVLRENDVWTGVGHWFESGPAPSELMLAAEEYRSRAYAPYSSFSVGAALLVERGAVIGGCNVENSSYGLSLCAERVAMSRAVAEGSRVPLAIAVAGPPGVFCPPCGACRQFLLEFNPNLLVVLRRGEGCEIVELSRLLPASFSLTERTRDV
jgi:cytidine deaminase